MKWHAYTAAQTLRFSGISKAARAGHIIVWREMAMWCCDLPHSRMSQIVIIQPRQCVIRSEDESVAREKALLERSLAREKPCSREALLERMAGSEQWMFKRSSSSVV